MKKLIILLQIIPFSCSGQDEVPGYVNEECKQEVKFNNLVLKYPIDVKKAKEEYKLRYSSNGYFVTLFPFGPRANKYLNYNFYLLFSGSRTSRDREPEETYFDRSVKGYEFIYTSSINYDSLKSELQKQFGHEFVRKRKVYPEDLKFLEKSSSNIIDVMKISPCLSIAMYRDDKPDSLLILMFYFDMKDETVVRFFN